MSVVLLDFDGVVSEGYPITDNSIIVSGRTFDEAEVIYSFTRESGKPNTPVYFNPIHLLDRGNHTVDSRNKSAYHKVSVIKLLQSNGVKIDKFVEDDPLQADLIKSCTNVYVEFVESGVEK
jgi:hypothetical protein